MSSCEHKETTPKKVIFAMEWWHSGRRRHKQWGETRQCCKACGKVMEDK